MSGLNVSEDVQAIKAGVKASLGLPDGIDLSRLEAFLTGFMTAHHGHLKTRAIIETNLVDAQVSIEINGTTYYGVVTNTKANGVIK